MRGLQAARKRALAACKQHRLQVQNNRCEWCHAPFLSTDTSCWVNVRGGLTLPQFAHGCTQYGRAYPARSAEEIGIEAGSELHVLVHFYCLTKLRLSYGNHQYGPGTERVYQEVLKEYCLGPNYLDTHPEMEPIVRQRVSVLIHEAVRKNYDRRTE
jgi:hypothetical protein